jgi:hypothetical protein
MVMQSDSPGQWVVGLALFRRSVFRDVAQAPVTRAAAAIVAAGGLIVNGAGALAAGLSAESVIASALAGIAAALLAWVCLAALATRFASGWLRAQQRAPLGLRPVLRVAGFASVWRCAGVVPALNMAGDVLAAVALGVALSALAPGKPGRVALATAACVGVGAVVHAIVGRLAYVALLALWAWIGSIQL